MEEAIVGWKHLVFFVCILAFVVAPLAAAFILIRGSRRRPAQDESENQKREAR